MARFPGFPVRSPADAEELAAAWMRYAGYRDAATTGRGSDAGIDVESSGAVAQVKAQANAAGRPALQQLHGAASPYRKPSLFFSESGYTRPALQWAEQVGMALFTFTRSGNVAPVNQLAGAIERRIEGLPPPLSGGQIENCKIRLVVASSLVGLALLFIVFTLMNLTIGGWMIGGLVVGMLVAIPAAAAWAAIERWCDGIQRRTDANYKKRAA